MSSIYATILLLVASNNWPGMTQDVKRLTQECVDCQKGNKDKTGKASEFARYHNRIAMDVVGPLPLTARKNKQY